MTLADGSRPDSAPLRSRRAGRHGPDELDDATLIARVRSGDHHAYGLLYARHRDAVERLAAHLCRDRHEADDVAAEVFANTLRAIGHGAGPSDDLKPYLLRAVRHTIIKLRTRTDTGRATPTEDVALEHADPEDAVRFAGAVSHAFVELPPRFQDVLWMTSVEGRSPGEIASANGTDAGAVASLAHRARRALGRSYLSVATRGPKASPDCAPIRDLLPSYVQGATAGSTIRRVDDHLAACADCSDVTTQMNELNRSLASMSSFALVRALVARWRTIVMPSTGLGGASLVPLATLTVLSTSVMAASTSEPAMQARLGTTVVAADLPRTDDDAAAGDVAAERRAATRPPADAALAGTAGQDVAATTTPARPGETDRDPAGAGDPLDGVGVPIVELDVSDLGSIGGARDRLAATIGGATTDLDAALSGVAGALPPVSVPSVSPVSVPSVPPVSVPSVPPVTVPPTTVPLVTVPPVTTIAAPTTLPAPPTTLPL